MRVITQLAGDVRQACRAIARMPGLAAVVVVSLGIGIGVNTAVFARLQYMVFQPVPGAPGSGQLHLLEPRTDAGGYPGVSWLEYRDLRERVPSFDALLAGRMMPFSIGEPSRVERTFGQLVSGNYFAVLGVHPAIGRLLRTDDVEQIGREPIAVISYDLWQSRFGGAADVVGRTMHVNRQDLTIVGVTPEGFQGNQLGLQMDLWVPATLAQILNVGSRELDERDWRGYMVMGYLRAGVTRQQAQGEVTRAMSELARLYPDSNAAMRAEVLPFWQSPRGPQRLFVAALGVLQGIMLVVLVTICGNTATLMLTRASERQREVGVRLAVGAGRARIVSAVLVENVVLALLGAVAGAFVAVWATEVLRTIEMPGNLPIRFQTRVDAVGFAFTGALGLACGVIFGAVPAWHLARVDPQRAIRAGTSLAGPGRLRGALIGTQVALALVVLVVAALFVRSFADTRTTETGFTRDGLLLATYDLTGRGSDAAAFAVRVQERLQAMPGVEAAALSVSVPLDIHGLPLRGFTLEGQPRADGRQDRAVSNVVTPGYFQTMGIALRAGTDFVDLRETTAPPQAIVNEAFVQRYLADAEPLGRWLQSGDRRYTIVGVVATSVSDAFGEAPTPALYFSYRDRPSSIGEMHLRTQPGAEASPAAALRRAWRDIDPSLPLYNVRTMREHIERNLVLRRIPAQLFLGLGPMLLVLASIGIYGVVAHVVAGRTAEIGIRQALGATRRRVVIEIVAQSARAVAIGVAAGWVIASVIAIDLLRDGMRAIPLLVGVPLVLLTVAMAACWLPARRAAAVDPMRALRNE